MNPTALTVSPLRAPRVASAASQAVVVYGFTTLLVVHAAFRGLFADLDAAIYAAWYTELGTIPTQEFLERFLQSGWIFQAREQAVAKFEAGFALLSWALAWIGLPVPAYFATIAALSLYPKAYIALKYSEHPLLSVVWYASFCYLLLEMNAIRAGLAAGFMLAAIPALLERRWGGYLILVGIAASFHTAALIALVLPGAGWIARHGWRLVMLTAIAVVLSLVDITAILGALGGVFEKIADYKAAFDTGFGDVAYLRLNPVNSSSVPFMILGLLLVYQAFGNFTGTASYDRIGAVVYILPIVTLFAMSSFPIVGGRLSELLAIYQMIFVTRIVTLYNNFALGRVLVILVLIIQFSIQQFLTLHVDAFYFFGYPRTEMLLLIEQKSVIDAILAEILSNIE